VNNLRLLSIIFSDSDVSIKMDADPESTMRCLTELQYRRECGTKKVKIFEVSNYVKLSINGNIVRESLSNVERMTKTTPTEKRDVVIKDAPDHFKTYITEKYNTPLCELVIDDDERVTGSKLRRPEDASFAANFQFFHAPLLLNENSWEAEASMSGGDNIAAGKLTYEKQEPTGDLLPIKVHGTLKTEMVAQNGDKLVLSYTVKGQQIYDLKKRQWVSGPHEMTIASTPKADNKVPASMKGAMVVTMRESDAPMKKE
jgi:hypothetical protein